MYTTSDLKKGLIIDFDDAPNLVEKLEVSSPQARGAATIYKVRLRNLVSKQKIDKSFRSGETFGVPDFSKRPVQVLYKDISGYHFMDLANFEQFSFAIEDLEWESKFLVDDMEGIQSMVYNEAVIGLELPDNVVLEITETYPAVKGNSATARTKPATLETGHVVQVPEHIDQGERVTVDTRSGDFMGRAKS